MPTLLFQGGTSAGGNKFKDEYDNTVRPAKIFILLRSVEGSELKWSSCQHWAIVAKFDNRTISYEITQEKDADGISRISPQWSDYKEDGRFDQEIELGDVKTSPAALREKAKRNRFTLKEYHLITRNCQDWAKEMLRMIDEGLVKKLEEEDIRPIKDRLFQVLEVTSPCLTSSS